MTLSPMVRAYLECALWCSTDNSDERGGNPLDDNYTIEDCAPELIAQAVADCDAFAESNAVDLAAYHNVCDLGCAAFGSKRFGHDFWLTRNHHGAGFWDRGLGELGERLTKAANVYGSVDLYVDDMGQVRS